MTPHRQQRIYGTFPRSYRRTIPAQLLGTASRISARVSCRACGAARACCCCNPTRADTLHAERVCSGENLLGRSPCLSTHWPCRNLALAIRTTSMSLEMSRRARCLYGASWIPALWMPCLSAESFLSGESTSPPLLPHITARVCVSWAFFACAMSRRACVEHSICLCAMENNFTVLPRAP